MDTYENEIIPTNKSKSPFADSPYECAYVESEVEAPVYSKAPKAKKSKSGWKVLVVVLLLIAGCAGTALGVGSIWQNRMSLMEKAMDDKFSVLEKLYSEANKGNGSGSQSPVLGPMTPGQVYAQNVDAVVAINSRYEMAQGYSEGAGSGFIISPDGYVVTNYHVIEGASQVFVVTHNGTSYKAKVVGSEAVNDIALLKIEGQNLPTAKLGSSDKLSVGDQVVAIGNPLGDLTATLTVGYVSAKDRVVTTDGTAINMLQTDAAINSGNSGGPLFNMNGEVVGIITAKFSGNSGSGVSIEGLGFAIPTDDVAGIISDLIEFGYVTGAYLGVLVRDVDAGAQSYGLPAGAFVEEATKGMAADRAGIRAGDIIINLGGYDVDSVTTLTRVLRRFDAGDVTSVTVYRGGRRVYLAIELDEKPVEQEPSTEEGPTVEEGPTAPETNKWSDWFGSFFAPFF